MANELKVRKEIARSIIAEFEEKHISPAVALDALLSVILTAAKQYGHSVDEFREMLSHLGDIYEIIDDKEEDGSGVDIQRDQ